MVGFGDGDVGVLRRVYLLNQWKFENYRGIQFFTMIDILCTGHRFLYIDPRIELRVVVRYQYVGSAVGGVVFSKDRYRYTLDSCIL